jgi:hypothetical protein
MNNMQNKKNGKRTQFKYLPDRKKLDDETESIISGIIEGEKLNPKWYQEEISEERRSKIRKALKAAFDSIGGHDRDILVQKIEGIVTADTIDSIRQGHWRTIEATLCNLTLEKNRIPTRTEIHFATGLSSETIDDTIDNYSEGAQKKQRTKDLLLMRDTIIGRMFKEAFNGNIKAARLFMEITDPNPKHEKHLRIQNQQNNLVQVNGIVITEEQLKTLPEEVSIKLQEVLSAINQTPDNGEI